MGDIQDEDNLLASLLDVAEAELNSLNGVDNTFKENIGSKSNGSNASSNIKEKFLSDVDEYTTNISSQKISLRKCDKLGKDLEKNVSSIYEEDVDSSDEEGNRNYENQKYNEYGKEIKGLLLSKKSSNDSSKSGSVQNRLSDNWKVKNIIGKTCTPIESKTKSSELRKSTANVYTDPIFGISILNPLISSKVLQERMIGRKAIPICEISKHLRTLKKDDDWVIAGVICSKGVTKTSANGNQYIIWTMSDLIGNICTIALFLFGTAYKEFWKTQPGSVIGILNPSILDKREGSKDEVSRRFNSVCSGMLTKSFIQFEKKHAHIYKFVKSLLPKRPSERRSNVLVSRYCEILQGMETRIRMLNVTYMRYIDQQLICFIPGKVLDEINRLLRLIEMRFDPPSNNNLLLEELRDLSSMAMEHFDEHILPHLEKREEALQYENNLPCTSKPSEEERMHKELKKLYKRNRVFKSQLGYIISKTRQLCDKWNRQNMRVKKQSSIIKEQNAKLLVQATRIENHEMTISEMKKKIEELQSSFVEVKSKWEFESTQNGSPHAKILYKNAIPENVSSSITKSLSNLVQFENRLQRPNILKKIGNRSVLENRSVFIKPRTQKLKADELKRRKYKSMVDVDIWRRCCPTSRLSYSMWYRSYMRNKSTKLETVKKDPNLEEPSCSQSKPEEVKSSKKAPGFVYKSIIRQRCSKVFPLTCLNLERKRKSYVCPDVPSKISKIESNNFKALDLINKYLPSVESSSSATIRRKSCSTADNPSFTTEPISYKRKRENDGET